MLHGFEPKKSYQTQKYQNYLNKTFKEKYRKTEKLERDQFQLKYKELTHKKKEEINKIYKRTLLFHIFNNLLSKLPPFSLKIVRFLLFELTNKIKSFAVACIFFLFLLLVSIFGRTDQIFLYF